MNTDRLLIVPGRQLDDLLELVRLTLEANGPDSPFARELCGAAAMVRASTIAEP